MGLPIVTCKAGVRFQGFRPAAVRILLALARVSDRFEVVITAGSDGAHLPTSRHYTFEALDLRTKHLGEAQRAAFLAALEADLGPAFTVLLEGAGTPNEHAHVQPVKGSVYGVERLKGVAV